MNELLKHYKNEVEILRKHVPEDDQLIIEPFNEKIEELVNIFYEQNYNFGEAGFSLQALTETIRAALSFQILSPLTGEDSEWGETLEEDGKKYTPNLRDSGVFKDEDGVEYFNKAIVWSDSANYQRFTGKVEEFTSQQKIKGFPMLPKTFYIDVELVDCEENTIYDDEQLIDVEGKKMVYRIKNKKDLDQVFEFYNK